MDSTTRSPAKIPSWKDSIHAVCSERIPAVLSSLHPTADPAMPVSQSNQLTFLYSLSSIIVACETARGRKRVFKSGGTNPPQGMGKALTQLFESPLSRNVADKSTRSRQFRRKGNALVLLYSGYHLTCGAMFLSLDGFYSKVGLFWECARQVLVFYLLAVEKLRSFSERVFFTKAQC